MAAPLQNLFNYAWMNTTDTGAARSDDPAIQALIDAGVLTKDEISPARTGSGENGVYDLPASYRYGIDPTKVPTTKYGDITTVRPASFGDFKLRDPSFQYNDPNYGAITPIQNTIDPSKQRDWVDMIGPIFAGSLVAAAGAPWFLQAGLSGAKALGSGNFDPFSLASSAIPGLGDLGIPPEVIQALKAASTGYGAYSAVQQLQGQGQTTQPPPLPGQPVQSPTVQSQPTTQPIPQAGVTLPVFPSNYDPSLFGDFGSMIAPSDGSAMVAGLIAPGAYNNSYEANSQIVT